MTIPKQFVIQRQGRDHVLYAGLLDLAHAAGLKAIRTRLIQNALEVNGWTTIVAAEVELGDGRIFSGIGDANERNVPRNIAPHAVRMAETRAKARALRDALNIGAVALEELADDEDAPAPAAGCPPGAARAATGEGTPAVPRRVPAAAAGARTSGADQARALAFELHDQMLGIKPDLEAPLPGPEADDAQWSAYVDRAQAWLDARARRGQPAGSRR